MSGTERMMLAWRLSQEVWHLAGKYRNEPFGDVEVDFIGLDAFVRNKRSTGRARDFGDIEGLQE
jgi:hypothetical protein